MKFSKFMAAALLAAVVLVPLAARAQDPLLAPFITPGATLTGGTVLVGKTPGEFEVGSNGGASYRIPLVLPPGTSGVVPSLSLGYDSQAGSGLVGPGWILGGLSVVTRCGTHLVPDGVLDPVDFDANDRFCLDGQPLVAVGDGTYRTEIDAFSKVVPSGGTPTNPGKWTVWTKDGKVLEFGGTPNSQIETTLTGAPILVWTLNRSQDRAGNYYTVTYGEVPSYGFFAPLRIDYTGNSVTNLTPYNSVLFHYEARSDKPDAFVGGARTSTPVRLKQIEILAGTTRVRAYDLTYETGVSSTRSRLTQIKECGFNTNGTAACLPSTSVTWQEGVRDFADSSTWLPDGTPSVTNSENKQFIVDINGDAKSDYLWTVGTTMYAGISTGTNFQRVTVLPPGSGPGGIASVPDSIQYMLFGDLNGDGRTDYTWQVSGAWYAALSNGSDLSTLPRTTWLAANAVPGIPSYNPQGKQFLGDFNGDGRSDLVWVQNNAVYVGLSDGTRFVPPTGPWLAVNSGPGGIASVPQFAEDMKFGDLNGDGMTDYMWEVSNAWHVALSTGTQLVVDGTWLPANTGPGGDPVVGTENKEFLADLNGDGYMDFLWARTNKLYGRLSTGKGFASGTTWLAAGTGPGGDAVVPDSLGNMRVDDFNGDHRADYMWMIGGDWHVALSNGQTFDDRRTWIFAGTGPSNSAVYNNGDQFVGDFNGDGLADHMWYAGPGWNVALSAGPVPDLVTQLTDGLGAATNFHYLPLTDPAVYEKGTGAVYPMIDEQYPSYVLADVKVPNGLGGQTTRSFFYEHSRRDVRRGFPFGFESLDDLDQSRGTLTTTVYNQSYPIHGTQSRLEMRNSGGTLRMRTTSTVTPSNNAGATIFRYYVSQNLEEFFEPNGTTLTVSRTTTQQVDAYNNPTVVTSSASDGYGKTTTTTYSNDAVNWLIGMATQVQVVGSAPGVANVTRTTSAQYNTTTGLRTQEIVQPGTSLALTRIFTRDNYGNVTRIATSGTGITARNEDVGFDTKGLFATTETNPLGQVETRTFDGRFGVPLTVRGINGLTTTLSYDPIGRETSRTNPDGTVDTKVLALCPSAAVPCPGTGVISLGSLRSGSPSQYQVMDVLGREVRRSAIGFAGTAIHSDTEYDAMGRVSRKSLPYFQGSTAPWTTFAYDGLDRLITQTEPNGSVTAFGYTGLATAVTNALNQTRTELKNSRTSRSA